VEIVVLLEVDGIQRISVDLKIRLESQHNLLVAIALVVANIIKKFASSLSPSFPKLCIFLKEKVETA
jgi:hypothetical protein